jgi:shikimate dehydrogenase
LTTICRRIPQGEGVAQELRAHTGVGLQVYPWNTDSFRAAAKWASLIVNATPVGMYPRSDSNPWPTEVELPAGAFLYDLVYNPPVTSLVARARAADLQADTGLGMLVEQGALAFELWTGRSPPREEMRKAAEMQLEGGYA